MGRKEEEEGKGLEREHGLIDPCSPGEQKADGRGEQGEWSPWAENLCNYSVIVFVSGQQDCRSFYIFPVQALQNFLH